MAEDVLESNSLDLVWIEHLADQIGGAGMDRSQFGAARDPEISRHIFFGREGQLPNKDDEHDAAELPDGDAVLEVSFQAEEFGREEKLSSAEAFLLQKEVKKGRRRLNKLTGKLEWTFAQPKSMSLTLKSVRLTRMFSSLISW